jgi:hypothetical protein
VFVVQQVGDVFSYHKLQVHNRGQFLLALHLSSRVFAGGGLCRPGSRGGGVRQPWCHVLRLGGRFSVHFLFSHPFLSQSPRRNEINSFSFSFPPG